MATTQRPLPITSDNIDEVLAERAAVRREAGLGSTTDNFGEYLASARDEFLARFREAQEALASRDEESIRQLGEGARESEAEAIVADFPT